ncbi:hypothetical protein IVA80_07500 [Bradyrhizobium sp. 139]|uniref:DUF2846 domain-containing protein n=1 Tax=Bradyrhizobium sp. 139 TaxID=2782616 RepID=UPI001FFC0D3A|nr:DUF2846 domain-containing protein [Bradyrhizobium sp. 139]MCK1740721.1 hypothetical protein [Bradyrhizobium sp. 139]
MLLRGLVLLVAAALLCGCETTARSGLDYSETLRKVGPPKAGQTRIVVLREKGYGGLADAGWEFRLDGAPLAGLKTGTYVYVDRPAGQHQFVAEEAGFPGVTRIDFSARSGETLFFAARMSERKNAVIANASTGLLGYGLTLAMTSGYKNQGPMDFLALDETAARTTIAELKLAQ